MSHTSPAGPQTSFPMDVDLDRDGFFCAMLRELSGVLEKTVGEKEARSYVSLVGLSIGRALNQRYCAMSGQSQMDRDATFRSLLDLKRRIEGGFSIERIEQTRVTLVNTVCPFGNNVIGRPSLCMMTTNVFGHIVAQNLGYARVRIDEAIANGDAGCRVVIDLVPDGHGGHRDDIEFFRMSQ